MNELKFYFDESVELAASQQLVISGLDAVSAHSLDLLGTDDESHLQRATSMGRVLCTYDDDFLKLAASGIEHAGIVYVPRQKASIGDWVRELRAMHARLTAEDARNQVFFLPSR